MNKKTFSIFVLLLLIIQAATPVPASAAPSWLPITAPSAIVVDGATNRVIYAKTPNLRRAPASTTKLLTAIVVMDHMDMNAVVTIPSYVENIPPSKVHLRGGERYRVRELVRALLINSANDSAEALAYAAGGGSRAQFVRWMNEKVRSLGGKNSNFVNPSGLPAAGQYSTAYDMSRIMDAVQRYPFLVQTLETRTLIVKSFAGRKIFLRNHNRLLWRNSRPVIGKTGWTRLARHCFVGEFVSGNRRLLVAMLGSHAMWRDLRTLVDTQFGFSLFRSKKEKPKVWADKPSNSTIQQALQKAGYYKGPVNGKIGRKTRAAIKKFQKAKGIEITGNVGPKTWDVLRSFA